MLFVPAFGTYGISRSVWILWNLCQTLEYLVSSVGFKSVMRSKPSLSVSLSLCLCLCLSVSLYLWVCLTNVWKLKKGIVLSVKTCISSQSCNLEFVSLEITENTNVFHSSQNMNAITTPMKWEKKLNFQCKSSLCWEDGLCRAQAINYWRHNAIIDSIGRQLPDHSLIRGFCRSLTIGFTLHTKTKRLFAFMIKILSDVCKWLLSYS